MGALVLLLSAICAVISPDPSDCTDILVSLAPCLDYVTDVADYPSLDCCEQIPDVVHSHPLCLCAVVDGSVSDLLGVSIDTNRAVCLPQACDDNYDGASLVSTADMALRNTTMKNATELKTSTSAQLPQTHRTPTSFSAP